MTLFAGKAIGGEGQPPKDATIDWSKIKADVVSRLDVAAEYATLGVKYTRSTPDVKARRECHAIGRPDLAPSAFVNVTTGVYHDSGGEGESLHLFAFAVRHGGFGRWIDAARHYAEKAGVSLGKVESKSGGRTLEARFDYLDDLGSVRYTVFRYVLPNGKKTFTQHPPDGKGAWKWGAGCMDGVSPLPYRLPSLLDDLDSTIYIAEGEKAVGALVSAGALATTNHGGTGSTDKVWPRILEYFRGRDVIVIPDNDSAGRHHANKVCVYLAPVAKRVRLVELPGLAVKGDAFDWFSEGGTKEQLERIADATPTWTFGVFRPADPTSGEEADPEPDDGLPPNNDVTTVCLADVVAVPVEWLWPDRVPLGKLTLLAGEAKMGKSFLTMDFIARVSAGLEIPCGGGECMPVGSVVLLSAEDDLADTIKPRLVACGADFSKIHALTTIRLPNGQFGPFNLSYVPHLERAVVRTGDCKLIVIDPVPHYVGNGTDDHKNAQTRQLLEPLKDLANRLKVAVLMVTHLNKGTGTKALNRVTGSGAYTALARSNWLVVKDKDDHKRRLFLSAGTNLVEDPSGLAYRIGRDTKKVEWEDAPVMMTADEALAASLEAKKEEETPKVNKREQAKAWLADLLSEGKRLPSEEIFALAIAAGFTKDSMYKAKDALGIVPRPWSDQDRKWTWRLPPIDSVGEVTKTQSHEVITDDHPF